MQPKKARLDLDDGLQKEARLVFGATFLHLNEQLIQKHSLLPSSPFLNEKKTFIIIMSFSSSNNPSDDGSPADALTSSEQQSSYSTLSNAQLDAGS